MKKFLFVFLWRLWSDNDDNEALISNAIILFVNNTIILLFVYAFALPPLGLAPDYRISEAGEWRSISESIEDGSLFVGLGVLFGYLLLLPFIRWMFTKRWWWQFKRAAYVYEYWMKQQKEMDLEAYNKKDKIRNYISGLYQDYKGAVYLESLEVKATGKGEPPKERPKEPPPLTKEEEDKKRDDDLKESMYNRAIETLKKKKQELDLELITQEEYDKIKKSMQKYIDKDW